MAVTKRKIQEIENFLTQFFPVEPANNFQKTNTSYKRRVGPSNDDEYDNQISHSQKLKMKNYFLKNHSNHQTKPFLAIFGPSGCGKETTIKYILKKLVVEIILGKELVQKSAILSENDSMVTYPEFDNASIIIHSVKEAFQMHHMVKRQKRHAILIRDLPLLKIDKHKFDQLQKYLQSLETQILRTPCSTLLIFILNNQIYNDKMLQRLFGDSVFSKKFHIINLQKITETAMEKICRKILIQNGLNDKKSETILGETVTLANGDINHALTQLEFQLRTSNTCIKRGKPDKKTIEFNLFHSVAKVLYNKRKDPLHPTESRIMDPKDYELFNNDFYFEPKNLITQVPTSQQFFRALLHENVYSFCGDIGELSKILSALSEIEIMSHTNFLEKSDLHTENDFLLSELAVNAIMLHNFSVKNSEVLSKNTNKKGIFSLRKPLVMEERLCKKKFFATILDEKLSSKGLLRTSINFEHIYCLRGSNRGSLHNKKSTRHMIIEEHDNAITTTDEETNYSQGNSILKSMSEEKKERSTKFCLAEEALDFVEDEIEEINENVLELPNARNIIKNLNKTSYTGEESEDFKPFEEELDLNDIDNIVEQALALQINSNFYSDTHSRVWNSNSNTLK